MTKRKPVWSPNTNQWLDGGWGYFDDMVKEFRAAEDVLRALDKVDLVPGKAADRLIAAVARFDKVTGRVGR